MQLVSGFSKLQKDKKLELISTLLSDSKKACKILKSFWHEDPKIQKVLEEFSENTLSNFPIPFGVAPHFLINNKNYIIPMAIEESSVVAAASKAAKFWKDRGGFKAEVVSTEKVGQVHFIWTGDTQKLRLYFETFKGKLLEELAPLEVNMRARGGGVNSIDLIDCTDIEEGYYQLKFGIETCDAMGANFINTVLEASAKFLKNDIAAQEFFIGKEKEVDIIMSILSNYTPECLVRARVQCPINDLCEDKESSLKYAGKFIRAVNIARVDKYRATTHNKGIFNGIDAVVMATGNDFRAVEAAGHAYATKDGQYRSLSKAWTEDDQFFFELEIPLAIGTVGGLTSLHPLVKIAHNLLGYPDAAELMKIIACAGLAQNFAAINSLTTTGIQKGHMKMHLLNILRNFEATEAEIVKAKTYFKSNIVSFQNVREFIANARVETMQ